MSSCRLQGEGCAEPCQQHCLCRGSSNKGGMQDAIVLLKGIIGDGCSSLWGQEEENWLRGKDVGAVSVRIVGGKEWLVVGHQVALGGFGGSRASGHTQPSVGRESPRHGCADLWLCCSLTLNCKVSR